MVGGGGEGRGRRGHHQEVSAIGPPSLKPRDRNGDVSQTGYTHGPGAYEQARPTSYVALCRLHRGDALLAGARGAGAGDALDAWIPASEPWKRGATSRASSSQLRAVASGGPTVPHTRRPPKPPDRSCRRSIAAIASSGVPITQAPASTIWSITRSRGPGTGRGRPVTPSV